MSLLRKQEGFPKIFLLFIVAAVVVSLALALLLPVEARLRQPIFFLVFSVLGISGILGYSLWKRRGCGRIKGRHTVDRRRR